MAPERWEHGSDFHWFDAAISARAEKAIAEPWALESRWYGCGRDALVELVSHGRNERGWQRVWMPSYFCEDVVLAVTAAEMTVLRYEDDPRQAQPRLPISEARPGADVFVVCDYFGMRPSVSADDESWPAGVDVIADYTHDPWHPDAQRSRAHYAFASLRKTLPLAEGGVSWSPRGLSLPEPVELTDAHRARVATRISAMKLKRDYLLGRDTDKAAFRQAYVQTEQSFATTAPSAMCPESKLQLERLPLQEFRQRRRENYAFMAERLSGIVDVHQTVEASSRHPEQTPLALVILMPSEHDRNALRSKLIAERIYPAILWPSPNSSSAGSGGDFGARMLALHCDMRYDRHDLERVVDTIEQHVVDSRT